MTTKQRKQLEIELSKVDMKIEDEWIALMQNVSNIIIVSDKYEEDEMLEKFGNIIYNLELDRKYDWNSVTNKIHFKEFLK